MSIQLASMLTEIQVILTLTPLTKLRVKCATQVLSRIVAAAIETYATLGALTKEAIATYVCIYIYVGLYVYVNMNECMCTLIYLYTSSINSCHIDI